jgi:hypothetical protein
MCDVSETGISRTGIQHVGTNARIHCLGHEHATSRLQPCPLFGDGHGRFQHASLLLIVIPHSAGADIYSFIEYLSVDDGHVCVSAFHVFRRSQCD